MKTQVLIICSEYTVYIPISVVKAITKIGVKDIRYMIESNIPWRKWTFDYINTENFLDDERDYKNDLHVDKFRREVKSKSIY